MLVDLLILTCLIITIVGYTKAIRSVKELPPELLKSLNIKVYSLIWYPIILFVTFFPIFFANAVMGSYNSLGGAFVIGIFGMGVTHAIGFTNALVYGWQRRLSDKYEHLEPTTASLQSIDLSESLQEHDV